MHVIWTIVALLIVLGVVVFIHELGHFLAARWAGVRVNTFSIGLVPQLSDGMINVAHNGNWRAYRWAAMFPFMAKKICLTAKNTMHYHAKKSAAIICR